MEKRLIVNPSERLPVLALTCKELRVVIPIITTTKNWTNQNHWLFLSSLEFTGQTVTLKSGETDKYRES